MERQALLEAIMARMGATQVEDAERALVATLPSLGSWVGEADAAVLAAELPDDERLLRSASDLSVKDYEGFVAQIRNAEDVAEGFAREHALAVCHAVHDQLDRSAKGRLASPVWDEIVRPSVADRHADHLPARHGRTLADGRPGSAHPVSEGAADRAQSESVVRADNPHAGHKLSSGEPRAGEGVDWRPPLARED